MARADEARQTIVDLCRKFYRLGWVSGTGGGISVRQGDRIWMAPSGMQKEMLSPDDMFAVDLQGEILERPADASLRLSACAPLFLHAYRLRQAGAVIHSHSMHAMLASVATEGDFAVTHLEMLKGLAGVGYHDRHVVPVIDNTAQECDLADALADAMRGHPQAHAVLVRRHGVYIWGRDWQQAKVHAECYHFLFEAAVQLRHVGIDASLQP